MSRVGNNLTDRDKRGFLVALSLQGVEEMVQL
jgi:hypothetical protein